jgi:hypothetical protein
MQGKEFVIYKVQGSEVQGSGFRVQRFRVQRFKKPAHGARLTVQGARRKEWV